MKKTANHYWIWPHVSVVGTDGSIRFKTSGVDRNELHWSSEVKISPDDSDYPAMHWVYINRHTLPPLLERVRVREGLHGEDALISPDDGIYFLGSADLVDGWARAFPLKVVTTASNAASPTLRHLMNLTGRNCFLFVNGKCEAALSVAIEPSDESVSPHQALEFIQSITESLLFPPRMRETTPVRNSPP